MKGSKTMEQHNALFKKNILNTLSTMREEMQPQLFDQPRPQRDCLVQQVNFLCALINKIKEEFKEPCDVLQFIGELEGKYPQAEELIVELKDLLIDNNNRTTLR